MVKLGQKIFQLITFLFAILLVIAKSNHVANAQCVSQSAPTPQVGSHVNDFMFTNMWYRLPVRDYTSNGGIVISRVDGWPIAGRVHDFNPYPTYENVGANLKTGDIFKCLYKGTPEQLTDPEIWDGRIQNKRLYTELPGYTYFEIRVMRDNPRQFFYKINGRITDIQIMLPGYELFDQRFLRDEVVTNLAHLKVLRFMGLNSAPTNTGQTWAKRVSPNAPREVNGEINPWTDGAFDYSEDNNNSRGTSWELQIDIANYLNKDMWINIPALVDDNYIFELAKLIKERLKPSLNVYVEIGNEIWNFATPFNSFDMVKQKMWEEWQTGKPEYRKVYGGTYCQGCGIEDAGTAGYTGPNNVPLEGFRRWQARRLKEYGDEFIKVFGDRAAGGLGNRIRLILAGQIGYGGNGDGFNIAHGLDFLEKAYNDPTTPYKYLYGVAVAPYYAPHTGINSSLNEIVNGIDRNINQIFGEYSDEQVTIVNQGRVNLGNKLEALLAKAKTYGLKYVAYEGGNELSDGGVNGVWTDYVNTEAYFLDSRSGVQAKKYLDNWYSWCGYDALFIKNGDFLGGGYGIATQLNQTNPLRMAWVNTATQPAVPLATNRGGIIGNTAVSILDARKHAAYWSNWAHASYIELWSAVDNGKEDGNSANQYPWLLRCQKTGIYKIVVEGQNFRDNVTVGDIYLNEKLIVKDFNFKPRTPSAGGAWSDTITMEIPYGVHALRIRPRAPIPPVPATHVWSTGRWLRIQVKQFKFILNTELPPAIPKPILGDQVVCKNNSKASYEVSELDATVCEYEWTGLPPGARILSKVQVPNTNPAKFFSGQGTFKVFIDWTGADAGSYILSVVAKNQTNAGLWQSSAPRTFNVKVENCGFTYSPNPVCISRDVTFVPETMTNISKWEWNFGSGAVPSQFSTVQTPPVVKYSTAGTRDVTLRVTDNAGKQKTYYGTVDVTGCDMPIVVSPVNYCKNATAIPLTATGPNLKWYSEAGIALTGTPTPITTAVDTVSFYVSQMNDGIESDRARITVVVAEAPSAPVVSGNQSYCKGASAGANDLTSKVTATSGATLKWYTSQASSTSLANPTQTNTTIADTITWYISQGVGTCESGRSELTVQVNDGPQFTVENQNPTVCGEKGKLLLKGLKPSSTYQVSYNTVTPEPFTADATGQIELELNQGSYTNLRAALGTCSTTVSGPFSLADPASPNFNVVARQPALCGALGAVVLKGLIPNRDYKVSYTGVTNQVMRSPTDSIQITLPKGEYSNFIVDLNNCKSTQAGPYKLSDPVIIPPVVFLNNFSYCQNQVINVTDITSRVEGRAGYELRWYREESVTPTNNPEIPNVAMPGNYKIGVSQADANGCESDKQEITIQINPSTVLDVERENPTACGTLDGKLMISGLANLKEYTIEYKKDMQTQTVSKVFSNENGTITVGNLGAGAYKSITATPVLGNSCATNSTQELLLSEPGAPDAPIVTGGNEYCLNTPIANLVATPKGTGTIEWYSDADLTQSISVGNSIAPSAIEGTKVYYAIEKVGACKSQKEQATVTIFSAPKLQSVKAGTVRATCNGSGYGIELSGSEIGVKYTLFNRNNIVGVPLEGTGSAIVFVNQTNEGIYTVKASKGTKGCPAEMTGIFNIEGAISPTDFIVSGITKGCEGTLSKAKIDLSGSQAGVSYFVVDKEDINTVGNGSAIFLEMDAIVENSGTYKVRAQNIQTGCEADMTGSAEVKIETGVTQPEIAGVLSYCNKGTDQIRLAANTTAKKMWRLTPETAGSINESSGLVTWNSAYSGKVEIGVTVTSEACEASPKTDTHEATVSGKPTVSTIIGAEEICPGVSTDYKVQPQSGVNYIWEISNNGRLQDQNDEAGTVKVVYNLEFANNITVLTVRPQSTSCGLGDAQVLQIAKKEGCDLFIPNILTPNTNDGHNVWSIEGFENYPDLSVEIFNRWGTKVHSSKGNTSKIWDGTHNGSPLPTATYYYVIDKNNGSAKITGSVTVVRD